jgi:Arc/MetJ family transcription regulator
VAVTTIRVNAKLVDEAAKILGAKSRADAVNTALREIVALQRFKNLMKKHAGKLEFSGCDK